MMKKRDYREIAQFQDSAVDIIYTAYNDIILHGETVVWRCFAGSRFSYDIDAYIPKETSLRSIKGELERAATDYGIVLDKVKDTGNLMFIGLSLGRSYLKVEINHAAKKLDSIATRFERADGTYRDVISLSANDLIMEKIAAYNSRRFIRDIYDIHVLSGYAQRDRSAIKAISDFLANISPPVNESDLASLIYDGPVPSFKSMIAKIKGMIT